MKDVMLSIELFTIYFSTACWLIHKPKKEGEIENSEEEPKLETKVFLNEYFPNEDKEDNQEKEWQIDFSKLNLAACRKIAGELSKKDKNRLGISQKVNGQNKPVEQLRQEIKSRWRHHQSEVELIVRSHCNSQAKIEKNKTTEITKIRTKNAEKKLLIS